MSNKHIIMQNERCIVPGAISDEEYGDECNGKILINPPPDDRRCELCRKHVSEIKPFGGAGDPLVGDFTGMKLIKTWREEFPGSVGSSWECRDCIVIPGGIWELEEEEKLGRALTDAERNRMREDFKEFMEDLNTKDRDRFYEDILLYIGGKPNEIKAGTIGEIQAEIAKSLTSKNPELLSLQNKDQLLDAINAEYDANHSVKIKLTEEEMELAGCTALERSR